MAEAVKRETLSHAGDGPSSSKPMRRFLPNVAGGKRSRNIPAETQRAVKKQLDIAAMMDAVKEDDVGTTQPVESLPIELLAQDVTPEKEVATVHTVPRSSYTRKRTPRASARPTVGQLRPKGASFPLSQPCEEDAPLDIFGHEETVSDVVGLQHKANDDEVLQVPSNPDEVDGGCVSGIHEVSSTGVPGGLHSLDNNLKLWSSR